LKEQDLPEPHGESMKSREKNKAILIVGIGAEFRGDDAAGLHVARRLLSGELPPCATILEMKGDGASLMEQWKGSSHVILVDAVTAELPPGSVIRFDARRDLLPANLFATSSHSFGLAQAIAVSLALDELPPCVILFGIQAKSFQIGSDLSPEVRKAVDETSDAIQKELAGIVSSKETRGRRRDQVTLSRYS
jgi:hydrogenase maturation protease